MIDMMIYVRKTTMNKPNTLYWNGATALELENPTIKIEL